jgi:hypothetical protein
VTKQAVSEDFQRVLPKLQRGMDRTFTVFPKTAEFLQPRKGSLNYPTLGYYHKRMQFIAFNHFRPDKRLHRTSKVFSAVTAGTQDFLDF